MTLDEFQRHMGRLIEQFGKSAYSQARSELIWREVKEFSPRWWENTVNQLLFTCRQAPLYAEFAEEISKARERLHEIDKRKHTQDAKDFWRGSYQPEDVQAICETVRKRMQGGISDSDYGKFQQTLKNVADSSEKMRGIHTCDTCNSSGLVFHPDENNCEWAYRCFCKQGDKQPKSYMVFQRQVRKAQ